jgi:chromosome segregation ATPase
MSTILAEINRRLAEKNKLLEEKTQQYNKLSEELNKLEELKKETEVKIAELDKKIDSVMDKENQLLRNLPSRDFVIQLDDGTFEVASKDDVEIVSDKDVIKNVKGLD